MLFLTITGDGVDDFDGVVAGATSAGVRWREMRGANAVPNGILNNESLSGINR